jgi:hypothetical protein
MGSRGRSRSTALEGLAGRAFLLRFIAVLAFLGYVATSRAVLHLYPFSIFNMYSSERVSTASRIVARDATGAVHEVDELTDWDCDAPPDLEPSACPRSWPFYYIPYLDREAAAHVAAHAAKNPDAAPVAVIRRIFRLSEEPGDPVIEDCVLSRCRAVLR